MEKIVLYLEDESKKETLLNYISQLDYVKIDSIESVSSLEPKAVMGLFGIWKDREISVEEIRKRSWRQ